MGGSGEQKAGAVVSHRAAIVTATRYGWEKTEKRVVSASRHKLAAEKSRGDQSQLVVKSENKAHQRVCYKEEKIQVKVERTAAHIRIESKEKILITESSKKAMTTIVDLHGKTSKGAARHEICVMKGKEKQQILQLKGSSNVCHQGSLRIAEKANAKRTHHRV